MTANVVVNPTTDVGHGAKVTGGGLKPLGYEQITDLSSAESLTVPAGAKLALFQAEAQDVRWRDDGTAPTATVGMPIAAADMFLYTGDLSAVQFIEVTSGAILNVSYY